jgi:nucleoside-diphosphate-sugar epimerase
LLRGKLCYPYNVGSELGLSIAEIARVAAKNNGGTRPVEILGIGSNEPRQRYVPSTGRAQKDLCLVQLTSLEKALMKTIDWNN